MDSQTDELLFRVTLDGTFRTRGCLYSGRLVICSLYPLFGSLTEAHIRGKAWPYIHGDATCQFFGRTCELALACFTVSLRSAIWFYNPSATINGIPVALLVDVSFTIWVFIKVQATVFRC